MLLASRVVDHADFGVNQHEKVRTPAAIDAEVVASQTGVNEQLIYTVVAGLRDKADAESKHVSRLSSV